VLGKQLTLLHLFDLAREFRGNVTDSGRAESSVAIAVVLKRNAKMRWLRGRTTARVVRGKVGHGRVLGI
jgi:hypothetical protein